MDSKEWKRFLLEWSQRVAAQNLEECVPVTNALTFALVSNSYPPGKCSVHISETVRPEL
jgi:hypothetical protein